MNIGFRRLTLHDIVFEQPSGGYLNDLDENLGLPRRLDDGEEHVLEFAVEDIEPDTTALVIRDTHRREHRLRFTAEIHQELAALRSGCPRCSS